MSSVGNPRRNARKRIPPATHRRALELLAASRDGATEAILVARGFSIEQIVDLVSPGSRPRQSNAWSPGDARWRLPRIRITGAGWRRARGTRQIVGTGGVGL
jgi:hypothetical protein